MLRILEQKGYVSHEKDGRAFVYLPRVGQQEARRSALGHLLGRLFDGSPSLLLLNLLRARAGGRDGDQPGSSCLIEAHEREARERRRDLDRARHRARRGASRLCVAVLPRLDAADALRRCGGRNGGGAAAPDLARRLAGAGATPGGRLDLSAPRSRRQPAADARPASSFAAARSRPVVPWARRRGGARLAIVRLLQLQRALTALRRVRARCRPLPSGSKSSCAGVVRRPIARPACPAPRVGRDRCPPSSAPAIPSSRAGLGPERPRAGTLDLLVLHEHAHVERGDDRDLLVQASIAAVFAWHPAVWWIGRRLDEERERACDDRGRGR